MSSEHKFAAISGTYAGFMVLVGLIAYAMAPVGAAAATALAVPVVCAVLVGIFAVMALSIRKNRRVGMIGIHVGLILPLLFAIMIGHRAWVATQGVAEYREAEQAYQQLTAAEPAADTPDRRSAFFEERDVADHDRAYLRNALWVLTAGSLVAFGALLATRPKPPQRTETVQNKSTEEQSG